MLSTRHIPPPVDAAGSATLVGIAGPLLAGWALTAYDDAPDRFFAVAERR